MTSQLSAHRPCGGNPTIWERALSRRSIGALKGAFKVPTLRNVTLTAPYFQAGQFTTLSEVMDFYNAPRGHAMPAGAGVQLHWHIHMQKAELSANDVADVLAFLDALADTSMAPQVPSAVPSGLPVVPRLNR